MNFHRLRCHVGHQIAIQQHGMPVQNVMIVCTDCQEVLLDLDADGDAEHGLVRSDPGPPTPPPTAMTVPLPVAA